MLHRRLQQLELMVEEQGPDAVAWDSDQPENFTYLYDPAWLLVRAGEEDNVRRTLDETGELLDDWGEPQVIDSVVGPLPLSRLRLPERRDGDPRRVQLAMDALDRAELNAEGRPQVAAPEHWVHLAAGGTGRLCPATEPEPADPRDTWPEPAGDPSVGAGARVVVVDSGWHPPAGDPAGRTPWLDGVTGTDEGNIAGQPLRPYAGHGTFIAGTVRSIAHGAEIWVERFFNGTALREVDMVLGLLQAFEHEPNLINLSAGCTSRKDRPLLSFEVFHEVFFKERNHECLLVAAAGNDGVADPFWPASFDWAIGVGSLNRDETVSDFSNFGSSADLFAVGADLVNAYPDGTYTCHEVPHTGEQRVFKNGAARWSGTSFASPTVVGLIAAEMDGSVGVSTAWANVRGRLVSVPGSGGTGTVDALRPPYT
ncbi:S8 family peptidase [Nocardioides taihuensis]|uniref:S8 family serine peptidase n=1 Tax=Nocardioides taihuensis TaxID=1835606 RepID=A0ABW0BRR8_9ACTN